MHIRGNLRRIRRPGFLERSADFRLEHIDAIWNVSVALDMFRNKVLGTIDLERHGRRDVPDASSESKQNQYNAVLSDNEEHESVREAPRQAERAPAGCKCNNRHCNAVG